MKKTCLIALLVTTNVACLRPLPPPAPRVAVADVAPLEQRSPRITGTLPPVQAGKGRVFFDCADRPCVVVELRDGGTNSGSETAVAGSILGARVANAAQATSKIICTTTPCWSDFDFGSHVYRFEYSDFGDLCPEVDAYYLKHRVPQRHVCYYRETISAASTTVPVVIRARLRTEERWKTGAVRNAFPASHTVFEMPEMASRSAAN